jgi:hypothetical protein
VRDGQSIHADVGGLRLALKLLMISNDGDNMSNESIESITSGELAGVNGGFGPPTARGRAQQERLDARYAEARALLYGPRIGAVNDRSR